MLKTMNGVSVVSCIGSGNVNIKIDTPNLSKHYTFEEKEVKSLEPVVYNSVNPLWVAKLHSNLTYDLTISDVRDRMPVIYGSATLPGGFVVTHHLNKAFDSNAFDSEYGKIAIRKELSEMALNKLYELEAYRLYMNLLELDKIAVECDRELKYSINADFLVYAVATLMANEAYTVKMDDIVVLYAPAGNVYSNKLKGTNLLDRPIVIQSKYYDRIKTILSTYIQYLS